MEESKLDVKRRELLESANRTSQVQNSHDSTEVDRRGLLSRTAATIGGTLFGFMSISDSSSAEPIRNPSKAQATARKYASTAKLRAATEIHATSLLEKLASDGYIESASPKPFSSGKLHRSVKSYVDSTGGAFITATVRDGKANVKIYLKRPLSGDRELQLIVEPRSGKSRATIRSTDRDLTEEIALVSDSSDDVTTENCICDSKYKCGTVCGWYSCEDCAKIKVKKSCSDLSCEGCELIDYSCCGGYQC